MIGIICGTSGYDANAVEGVEDVRITTPFGAHSDIMLCSFHGVETAFCFRHNRDHSIPPHGINFRANVYTLKKLGVDRIISLCTAGSLREDFMPGDIVVPDQFIDFGRGETFFNGPEVYHVSLADPFCPELRGLLINSSKTFASTKESGTYLRISGPQFSTRAASRMYRQFADIIGMTGVPEAILAREQGICLAIIATVTDYDVWAEKSVSMEEIKKTAAANAEKLKAILADVVPKIPDERSCSCSNSLDGAKA